MLESLISLNAIVSVVTEWMVGEPTQFCAGFLAFIAAINLVD